MRKYLSGDEWTIREEGFDPDRVRSSESIFSIGNGHMGQRANFEEDYSGDSLDGNYIAGIYYPDKTKVGWWKNGYPEYFAKVINAPSWIGVSIHFNGKKLDLYQMKVLRFSRDLNMQEGILRRNYLAAWEDGEQVEIQTERFISLPRKEIAALRFTITPVNVDGHLEIISYLNGDVRNEDANYHEKFWEPMGALQDDDILQLQSKTKKTAFVIATAMTNRLCSPNGQQGIQPVHSIGNEFASSTFTTAARRNEPFKLEKLVSVVTSRDHDPSQLSHKGILRLREASASDYDALKAEHTNAWLTF